MLFTPKNVKKFQLGGAMPAEDPTAMEAAPEEMAPELTAEQDPMMMLAQAAAQALQAQDCLIAMQVCEGLLQMMLGMAGGAPAEPQGEPVFRKGGVLLRRIKK